MSLFKRGNIWWYTFTIEGVEYRATTKATNKQVAKEAEATRREEVVQGFNKIKQRPKAKKFVDAATEFIEQKTTDVAPKTIESYEDSMLHLRPSFREMVLHEISADKIKKYRAERKKEKASNRTINIEVGFVRMVLKKHKMWFAIADELKFLKENRDAGRELTEAEQDKLLSAAKNSVSRSLFPAILVSIHTGLRKSELRLLRWKQVDLINGTIQVGKSKTEGGKGRIVYLSQTAQQTLQQWRSQFPNAQPQHFLFPSERYGLHGRKGQQGKGGIVKVYQSFPDCPIGSWQSAWDTVKQTVGIECRWHDLRHSSVSAVAAGGATESTLKAMYGWMSPKMIEHYSHVRAAAKKEAVTVFDRPKMVQ